MPANKVHKKSDRTKAKIYNTAMNLFENRGYDNVSVHDICSKSSVSIGTFYYYFPSKIDLMLEISNQFDEVFENQLQEKGSDQTYFDYLLDFFDLYAICNERSGCGFSGKIIAYRNTHLGSRKYIKKPMYSKLLQIIERGQMAGEITKSFDAEFIMDTLLVSARGLVYNWCLHNGSYDLRVMMRKYMEIVSKGILTNN
ncbi:MAG: TetR/AcrR family transcriptional regulator [Clostridiales bacterium]|nr:TetR/AcrR family transcriptional regulator [Clostridiales bacterium]